MILVRASTGACDIATKQWIIRGSPLAVRFTPPGRLTVGLITKLIWSSARPLLPAHPHCMRDILYTDKRLPPTQRHTKRSCGASSRTHAWTEHAGILIATNIADLIPCSRFPHANAHARTADHHTDLPPVGVFFPFVIGNLQTMYGKQNNLWVCAMISSSFATGGLM